MRPLPPFEVAIQLQVAAKLWAALIRSPPLEDSSGRLSRRAIRSAPLAHAVAVRKLHVTRLRNRAITTLSKVPSVYPCHPFSAARREALTSNLRFPTVIITTVYTLTDSVMPEYIPTFLSLWRKTRQNRAGRAVPRRASPELISDDIGPSCWASREKRIPGERGTPVRYSMWESGSLDSCYSKYYTYPGPCLVPHPALWRRRRSGTLSTHIFHAADPCQTALPHHPQSLGAWEGMKRRRKY